MSFVVIFNEPFEDDDDEPRGEMAEGEVAEGEMA